MTPPNTQTESDAFDLEGVASDETELSEQTGADGAGELAGDVEHDDTALDDDDDDDDHDDDESRADAAAFEAAQKEQEEQKATAAANARRAQLSRKDEAPLAPAVAPTSNRVTMLARIKPFNSKKGQTMRTHALTHNGVLNKFAEGMGWYTVDAALANRLKQIRCSDMDPESNFAFDVCTPDQARKTEAREEQAKELATRAPSRRPRSATTA